MDPLTAQGVAIVMAAIVLDRTRAYRVLPVLINRLRRGRLR